MARALSPAARRAAAEAAPLFDAGIAFSFDPGDVFEPPREPGRDKDPLPGRDWAGFLPLADDPPASAARPKDEGLDLSELMAALCVLTLALAIAPGALARFCAARAALPCAFVLVFLAAAAPVPATG